MVATVQIAGPQYRSSKDSHTILKNWFYQIATRPRDTVWQNYNQTAICSRTNTLLDDPDNEFLDWAYCYIPYRSHLY